MNLNDESYYFNEISGSTEAGGDLNIYMYSQAYIDCILSEQSNRQKGKVGIPLSLGQGKLLPFWVTFFSVLGYEVIINKSADCIKSKACLPVRAVENECAQLLNKSSFIFLPCQKFYVEAIKARGGCAAISYYSEILRAKIPNLTRKNFIMPYLDLSDRRQAIKALNLALKAFNIKYNAIKKGFDLAKVNQNLFERSLNIRALEILKTAQKRGVKVIILSGRECCYKAIIDKRIDKILSKTCAVLSLESLFIGNLSYVEKAYKAAFWVAAHANSAFVHVFMENCTLDISLSDGLKGILENYSNRYFKINLVENNKNMLAQISLIT